jgi:type IV pilus assembly protein PilY1
VRYTPPVRADGSIYTSQTRANTGAWTAVTTDGFRHQPHRHGGPQQDQHQPGERFPDLKWCDANNNNCVYNSSTYTYPTSSRYRSQIFYTNPYYYTINIAEYCTDANLTSCKTVPVGAAAPSGYPVAAKVRWCDRNLTTCQAKYDDTTYKYPRFGNPNAGVTAAYGTITIGSASGSSAISSVTVGEPGGRVDHHQRHRHRIEPAPTPASRQTTAAQTLAASIINKSGLTSTSMSPACALRAAAAC